MDDLRDYELIACSWCGQTKKRIRDGKRPESKETRFVDEQGKEWNGRKSCPPCHKDQARLRKQLNKKNKDQAKKNETP